MLLTTGILRGSHNRMGLPCPRVPKVLKTTQSLIRSEVLSLIEILKWNLGEVLLIMNLWNQGNRLTFPSNTALGQIETLLFKREEKKKLLVLSSLGIQLEKLYKFQGLGVIPCDLQLSPDFSNHLCILKYGQ